MQRKDKKLFAVQFNRRNEHTLLACSLPITGRIRGNLRASSAGSVRHVHDEIPRYLLHEAFLASLSTPHLGWRMNVQCHFPANRHVTVRAAAAMALGSHIPAEYPSKCHRQNSRREACSRSLGGRGLWRQENKHVVPQRQPFSHPGMRLQQQMTAKSSSWAVELRRPGAASAL